ncbi:hypothetical protein AMS68_005718 [Peltaster fructicola]|uniref:General negative regulator of transcription subunit n=1 Tax=Peltaster fructicola TaxID=286661 RepID=A0A6H0XZV9_9PEZI|nr:hypothetical protein AMS68_005718 [Peltaster fructicola]
MAARKLQQEIDKEFKRIAEGVGAFQSIHEKLLQSTNPSQKEKLEDALKKEIKKLQRSRDKVKGWVGSNDIKDKKPLMDQRRLIETQMETFKAVEKEMKTKAFSKEGLSAATKLDPKEKEKLETCNFISDMVDELGRQIETIETEQETLQAGVKKGKKDTGRADRLAELERVMDRHKWHVSKLEIMLRLVENDKMQVDEVRGLEEEIKYYVEQNQEVDFMDNEDIYCELNLEEEEDTFGMTNDLDKVSSQDAQSIQDEPPEAELKPLVAPANKGKAAAQPDTATQARRPSVQLKTPLPVLSTLHAGVPIAAATKVDTTMKPAPIPTIPVGQTLKYASAAAAAAASEKTAVGISPLPPPPNAARTSESASPAPQHSVPVVTTPSPSEQPAKPQEPLKTNVSTPREEAARPASVKPSPQPAQVQPAKAEPSLLAKLAQPPSPDSGVAGIALSNGAQEEEEEESIYHLPSSLSDLLGAFEETKKKANTDGVDVAMLNASRLNCPVPLDAEKPNHYKPANPWVYAPAHYPQEPLGIFDDPRLYSRIDTDSLFYAFYYRQGTYQQYLAAKTLKSQSWRFHKQYQTWFQRHEEPKTITEEFELGTYRFFDYESTWMNRRKAEFKFAYKFLEDDL